MSDTKARSSNVHVMKCKDAPPRLSSKNKYAHPVIIIPNESRSITVFTVMTLMLFVAMDPKSGLEDAVELRTVSTPRSQGDVLTARNLEIQPVLTSKVADFMMRCKLTMWTAPTALVNGGWCMCKTKQEFEGLQVCFCCSLHAITRNLSAASDCSMFGH